MPRPQTAPSQRELEKYLAKGLTQAQIVSQWEHDSGLRVSRSAIAMAISRLGIAHGRARDRHKDLLPWRVKDEHRGHSDARMLRLEARRRKGGKVSEDELRRLGAWLERLEDQNAVVHYEPETDQGFWWVAKQDTDADIIREPKRSASLPES